MTFKHVEMNQRHKKSCKIEKCRLTKIKPTDNLNYRTASMSNTFVYGKILPVLAAKLLEEPFDKVPDFEVVGKDDGVEDQVVGKL